MKSFKFWYNWLVVASCLIILFGLSMVLFSNTFFFAPFNKMVQNNFSVNEDLIVLKSLLTWLYAVLGATMIGWGICILYILQNAFTRKERWAWFAVTIGLLAWFIPDTFMSYFCGAIFNVVLNFLLLIVFLLPLIFTFKELNTIHK
jgi:hypothetical protein